MSGFKTQRLVEFLLGLLFGCGLLISGMTDPAKVLGLLDLGGAWDPSLAFVMGGAIAAGLWAFWSARQRSHGVLGGVMHLPSETGINKRLVVGALIFGVGWGLAGFCPGPAIVAVGAGYSKAVIFVAAMVAGMGVFALTNRRTAESRVGV